MSEEKDKTIETKEENKAVETKEKFRHLEIARKMLEENKELFERLSKL